MIREQHKNPGQNNLLSFLHDIKHDENISTVEMVHEMWTLMGNFHKTKTIFCSHISFLWKKGAGHETVANTLCFAIHLLARYPEKQEKLFEEAKLIVQDGDTLDFDAIHQKLPYTTAVFYETLRMFPAVPLFPRILSETANVGGFDIAQGSSVFVTQQYLNTSDVPQFDQFLPERFGAKPKDLSSTHPLGLPSNDHEFSFLPFGAGQRNCVGQHLALIECVSSLAILCKNFRFSLNDKCSKLETDAAPGLMPRGSVDIVINLRQ